MQKKLF